MRRCAGGGSARDMIIKMIIRLGARAFGDDDNCRRPRLRVRLSLLLLSEQLSFIKLCRIQPAPRISLLDLHANEKVSEGQPLKCDLLRNALWAARIDNFLAERF